MFYKFHRDYIGNGEGGFYDVLPKTLTLNKVNWYAQPTTNSLETMFKEVTLKPYERPDIDLSIQPYSDKNWKQNIWDTLKKIIFNAWDTKRFHVIAHSGGIDSRILSTIIKELYIEHGKDWLGDILFVENGGEQPEFEAIMKHEGWTQTYSFNDPVNFHNLDFDTFHQKFNGSVGYPFNFFYDGYDKLIKSGTIPKDFQGFAAFGCYIDQAFRIYTPDQFFEKDYTYQTKSFNRLGNWVFPWWHHDYIKEIAKYIQVRSLGRTRISDTLNPIPSIPNVAYKDVLKRGFRHISDEQLHECMVRYYGSWYDADFLQDNEIRYCSWWGKYAEASICEHLIKKGYNIVAY